MKTLWNIYTKFALVVTPLLILILLISFAPKIYSAAAERVQQEPTGTPAAPVGPVLWYSNALLTQVYPDWEREARDAMLTEHWSRTFICAPLVHYREESIDGVYVNVREEGFRETIGTASWPPDENTYNIFFFGSSNAFGYGVTDAESIAAQLQLALSDALPDAPLHVYNFGRGGYYSSMEVRLLENLLIEGYRPDAVVFFDGHADAWFNSWFGGEGPYNWQLSHCEGYQTETPTSVDPYNQRAQEVADFRVSWPGRYDERLTTEAERVLDVWQANRQIVRALAEAFDFDAVFVWQPSVYYKYERHVFPISEVLRDVIRRTYSHMEDRRTAWETWDDFLYLGDLLDGRDELLFVDESHFNAGLSAEIGQDIADFILESEMIDES